MIRQYRPVDIGEIAPALMVALIALYYVRHFLKRQRAGGQLAHSQDEWRAEFGFDPGERLTHAWFGVMYVGPLRPDVDFSTLRVSPRIIAIGSSQPFGMPELTGRTCRVALSDRGRLAVSLEVDDDSSARDQLRALAAQSSGMQPLQQFGPDPRPELWSADRAFSKVPGWRDAMGTAPRLRGRTGELVSYELLHIVGPELPKGLTLWLDPEGARYLKQRWDSGGDSSRGVIAEASAGRSHLS
jgi:hypothetical protein